MTGEKTRLYKAMKKRDIRQYTLANRVGISAAVLSRYCSGQKEMPLYVAEKIADVIGCKLEEIIEVKKYQTKKPEPVAEREEMMPQEITLSDAVLTLLEYPFIETQMDKEGHWMMIFKCKELPDLTYFLRQTFRTRRNRSVDGMDDDMYHDVVRGLAERYEQKTRGKVQ